MLRSENYRLTFTTFNSFFLAWMKSGFFTRTRFYIWFGLAITLAVVTFWQTRQVATQMFSDMNAMAAGGAAIFWLLMFVFTIIFYLLLSGIFVYMFSALLTYAAQAIGFALGSLRHRVQSVTVAQDGLVKQVDNAPHDICWANVVKIVDTKRVVLFFTGRNSATIVPKTAFASAEDADAFSAAAVSYWTGATGGEDKAIAAHF